MDLPNPNPTSFTPLEGFPEQFHSLDETHETDYHMLGSALETI
jgi:hypothetical protein